MNQIPQRVSLMASVTETLRESLRNGEWSEFLPGERPLCDRLQVSRVTLRAALKILAREGLIEISHGLPTKIVTRPQSPANKSKVVGILIAETLEPMNTRISYLLNKVQYHLNLAGFEQRIFNVGRVGSRNASKRLESLTRQSPTACWVLVRSDGVVQRWFMERGLPTYLIGTCHHGIQLPSMDVNFEIVCLHAAGKLLGLGHRRIALLLPIEQYAGVVISQRGFLRAFETKSHPDQSPIVLHHDGTREGVCRSLNTAFRSPNRPTALIVAYAWHAVTAVGHLIRTGLRVPEDVSVISRDFEPFLRAQIPDVASYEVSHDIFASRLSRVVVELARTGTLAPTAKWIMPQFREGETTAKPAA